MQLIIISGLIGSGKSTVSKLLEKKGFYYLGADEIAKKILLGNNKVKKMLIDYFGNSILFKKNISIKKLRTKLIKDQSNKKIIDDIIHPHFFSEINLSLKKLNNKNVVVELPLLETCKKILRKYKIIVVDCSLKKRLSRILKKKKITKSEFTNINKMQKSRKFYINNANYVLPNNDTMNVLNKRFEKLYTNKLRKK
ncbi:MAG: dephospho-CoA kinase [Pseudomonadota bacterium]|nr:dephospho-CoA kinase [Pseudomonadota bacterium]